MFAEQAFGEQVFAISGAAIRKAHQRPSALHQRFPEKLSAFGYTISAKEKSGASISRSLCYYCLFRLTRLARTAWIYRPVL